MTAPPPTRLDLATFTGAIAAAAARLRDRAAEAGLEARVPSCPEWDVRALVTHQGMVHRWAAAMLRGESDHRTEDSEAAAAAAGDLLAWFDEGASALLDTLGSSPADVVAPVFLHSPPSPLLFWARRQAHETTVHAVDAHAAALGQLPDPDASGIAPELAADGVDELLRGFLPRRKARLRAERPYLLRLVATDTGESWQVRVSSDPPVTTPGGTDRPDATVAAPAVPLYLGLWNRYAGLAAEGRSDVLAFWRDQMRVLW